MDVLGAGTDLLLGEPVEGLAHEREVGVEMAVSVHPHERGEVPGVPIGVEEVPRGLEPIGCGAERVLATGDAGDEIGHGVRHERAGDVGLVGARLAVGESCSCRSHPRGDVSEVVGHDLVGIGAA